MAEDKLFALDIGDTTFSIIATWRTSKTALSLSQKLSTQPPKVDPSSCSLLLEMSDGQRAWKGELLQHDIQQMRLESPYGDEYLNKLYRAFSGDPDTKSEAFKYAVDENIKVLTVSAEDDDVFVILAEVALKPAQDSRAACKRMVTRLAARAMRLAALRDRLQLQETQISDDSIELDRRLKHLDADQSTEEQARKYQLLDSINRVKRHIRTVGSEAEQILMDAYLLGDRAGQSPTRAPKASGKSKDGSIEDEDDDEDGGIESLDLTQQPQSQSQSQSNPMLALQSKAGKGKRRRRGGRARSKKAKQMDEDEDDGLM